MSGPRWRPTRRGFLIGTALAGGGLALGWGVGLPEARLQLARWLDEATAPGSFPTDPLLWFELQPAGSMRLYLPKIEMGQGIHTALAQIAAEELELPWESLEIVQGGSHRGPPDPSGTQGSSSVATLYQPLRQAAATLREMLRIEAAARLAQPLESLVAEAGHVMKQAEPEIRFSYQEIVAGKEGEWAIPEDEPALKSPQAFQLIGRPMPRLDLPGKVTGDARYGYDARLEGMAYGAILRPPTIEGRLRHVLNADEVRTLPGVLKVVVEEGFVGVVAASRTQAQFARNRLKAEWDEGRRWQQAELEEIVSVGGRGGVLIQREGDAKTQLAQGPLIEASYRTPMAAHAPMEPQAALVDAQAEPVRVWLSTQSPTSAGREVAEALGLASEAVIVEPMLVGGGFGRKVDAQVAVEAARLSRASGRPVHVGWSREEEMRHGTFRPATHHHLRARLEGGRIVALEHQQASGDVLFSVLPEPVAQIMGADFGAWRGATISYTIPHRRTVAWRRKMPLRTSFWRGLGLLANTFALESFMDELAHQAGADPLAFRLAHLGDEPRAQRLRAVLEAAAQQAGWSTPPPSGRGRGIACATDVGTVVAAVAELSIAPDSGAIRVHRLVEAMECGQVINPNGATAQMEGNIIWGLGSALLEQVTVSDGAIQLRNFESYPLLTLRDAPEIETILLPSSDPQPYGVGEPPIGPVAAAVANALFDLTGQRVRQLPLKLA